MPPGNTNTNYSIMRRIFFTLFLSAGIACNAAMAQPLGLDSCRALALRNNKALAIAKAKEKKAGYDRKAAGTNYLPKVSALGGYVRSGDEISLLSNSQKASLTGMGTNMAGNFSQMAGQIVQQHPDLAPLIGQIGKLLPQGAAALNGVGQSIVDALRTDTRNMASAAIILTQPLYMGGKIKAYDRITHYAEQIAGQQLRADEQQILLETDRAYWQVVSLANKRKLALGYRDMLKRLEEDVEKMIAEGVATRASGLSVSVKLNEAEMTLTKVEDGLTLSRMLLCQVCGLPLDREISLADEELDNLAADAAPTEADASTAFSNRPELNQLQLAADIYREKVKIERSAFLPQLALTGGYLATNPGLTNGFENRFRGTWAVGVTLKVPVWHWGEGRYKVRAAKAEAEVASLQMADVREKIELQVRQSAFSVKEADKKYGLSLKNLEKADENLRTAQVGFREGVIVTSDLLAAQTAWLQAQSDKIDAQIDMKLTRAALSKALGTLQ